MRAFSAVYILPTVYTVTETEQINTQRYKAISAERKQKMEDFRNTQMSMDDIARTRDAQPGRNDQRTT
ncbi:MAG: hypothetical protein J6M07_09075, partial [Ruminococcus sp.]|nr:hypothetical protein [Ruminococcus sp.]